MRKLDRVLRPCWRLRLRCRNCGRRKTILFSWKPVWRHDIYSGWQIVGTELCPRCRRRDP